MNKVEHIKKYYPHALFLKDFDDCIIGMCCITTKIPIIAYSYNKIMDKLISEFGEDYAAEYYECQVKMEIAGPLAPCFINEYRN